MPNSPIFTQYYYNTTGDNAGLYTDPITGAFVDSRDKCGISLQLPCNFSLNNQYVSISIADSPCLFNWCTLINSIKSIAGSELIAADVADTGFALTGAYGTAGTQKDIALQNASLILKYGV